MRPTVTRVDLLPLLDAGAVLEELPVARHDEARAV
jgi:hypothetical protein